MPIGKHRRIPDHAELKLSSWRKRGEPWPALLLNIRFGKAVSGTLRKEH